MFCNKPHLYYSEEANKQYYKKEGSLIKGGVILEEAETKCGSAEKLQRAIAEKRVQIQRRGEIDLYKFASLKSKETDGLERIDGTEGRSKLKDQGEIDTINKFITDGAGSALDLFAAGMGGSSSDLLALPGVDSMGSGEGGSEGASKKISADVLIGIGNISIRVNKITKE